MYRDDKDRLRPITPRKKSGAKTGIPIARKARPRARTNKGRLPKGASMNDIITIEGVSKTRRAWLTDISLDTKTTYVRPGRDWAMDHNRTDVVDIDDPLAQRRRERLRTGKDRKTRKGKNKPKKPPKSKKKEGVGTVEYDGAVWKWDYTRKDWMLANFGGTLKGKAGRKEKTTTEKKTKPKVKQERDAVITHRSQATGGAYGEALHDVWITVDGEHYYVPSVPGNTIELNRKRDSLRDLIKLSGTEKRERSIGDMSIRGSKPTSTPGVDSQTRTFKSAGKAIEKGWELSGHRSADAKDVGANVAELEGWGLMTLTVPSKKQPDKYVVYARKHPEKEPTKAVRDLAKKNHQNVMMWNNEQWSYSYSKKKWVKEMDMTTGEDRGRLLGEPGVVVVTKRKFAQQEARTQLSPQLRQDLEQAFVNANRKAWGTNKHLSTEKIRGMSDAELKRNTKALNEFANL